jgi:hypothetical protein
MPPIDWIHIAMFVAGLALQFVTNRLAGSSPVPAPATPAPTPVQPAQPAGGDSKPLLDLIHKLLDQRQGAMTPQLDGQAMPALMSVVNRLLNGSAPAATPTTTSPKT